MKKKELLMESKAELIARARHLDLQGRSQMSKEELAGEIAKALTRAAAVKIRRGRKTSTEANDSAKPSKAAVASPRRALEERAKKRGAGVTEARVLTRTKQLSPAESDASAQFEPDDPVRAEAQPLRPSRPSKAARKTGSEQASLPGIESVDLHEPALSSKTLSKKSPSFEQPGISEDRLSGATLPKQYGRDKFVLLTRDPRWLFAYWEITPATESKIYGKGGTDIEGAIRVLRVYDCTGVPVEKAHTSFDVQIHPGAKSWYIHLPVDGRSWHAELGYIGHSGKFYRIFESNTVSTPRKGVSKVTSEKYRILDEEFDEIFSLSGGHDVSRGMQGFGGSALSRSAAPGLDIPEEWEWAMPTSGLSSRLPTSEFGAPRARDEFFFWVNCELILYGGTQPTATVTVQGEKIDLRPDGTFTMRYALPDGNIDLPVKAVRADGKETRKAKPIITRTTK